MPLLRLRSLIAALLLPSLLGASAPVPQDGWEDFVDGLKIRRTLAPPDAEKSAPLTKAGDCCLVQFYAWELTPDGAARKRLLDAAAFGQDPRQILVGEGREPAPLELALIGLRPGEGRQLRAPAGRWKDAVGPVLVEAQLLERQAGIKVESLQKRNEPQLTRAAKGDQVTFVWSLAVVDADGNPQPVDLPTKDPIVCALGDGTLVRGLDFGLRGMAAGETRQITVPAHLGYGDKGAGGDLVPPGSVMVFAVGMRKVERK